MSYRLLLCQRAVELYLRDLPLSRHGRLRLYLNLHDQLRVNGDHYRNDPELRLCPGSDCFRYDFTFRDAGTGRMYRLLVIVNDAAAAYGILRVVYVEDLAG